MGLPSGCQSDTGALEHGQTSELGAAVKTFPADLITSVLSAFSVSFAHSVNQVNSCVGFAAMYRCCQRASWLPAFPCWLDFGLSKEECEGYPSHTADAAVSALSRSCSVCRPNPWSNEIHLQHNKLRGCLEMNKDDPRSSGTRWQSQSAALNCLFSKILCVSAELNHVLDSVCTLTESGANTRKEEIIKIEFLFSFLLLLLWLFLMCGFNSTCALVWVVRSQSASRPHPGLLIRDQIST